MMYVKIKDEKGVTGIDITVAILIITIFVAVLASIFFGINANSKSIERKTEATYFAISEIERIKNEGFEKVDLAVDEGSSVLDSEGKETPYTKKVTVIDYADTEGNEDKMRNLVKKVTVEISYKNGNKIEKVELNTIMTITEN